MDKQKEVWEGRRGEGRRRTELILFVHITLFLRSGWFPADFVEKLWKSSPDAQRRRRQPGGGGGDSVHSGSIASLQASDWSRISPPQMA